MTFSAASLRAVLDTHVPRAAAGLVVALSGGADSAALLSAVLAADFRALPVRALHVDHGLQAAAAEFRASCSQLCARLGVALTIISLRVPAEPGVSLEAAARDARYAALAAALHPRECLLTAHHREDQAETLLLQALRGAGVKGLSAMPICRRLGAGWHVRPLLDVAQSELQRFGAQLADLKSIDPMNQDLRFDRSYLRLQVWPRLVQRWPGAGIALSRTARHMAQAQALLESAAAADVARLRDGEALLIPGLRTLSPLRRMNAVRFWLYEAEVEPPPAARLSEALRQVLDADLDQLPAVVWGDSALRRYRHRLFLTAAAPPRLDGARPWAVFANSRLDLGPPLGSLRWVAQPGGIAAAGLPETLIVRRRSGGETLKPERLARTQSVQHLCQLHGVLPWMRDALPLIFAGEVLIAVADLWEDARFRAAADAPGLAVEWRDAPIIG
ncbi:MAG: tRNA lysidine(34) synthetase TilS [Steroidobacteraceae bacterium]